MGLMLNLRQKDLVTPQLAHQARVQPKTAKQYQIVSLPQSDGSFVASIVEAPEIVIYDRSRKAAESRAAREFSRRPDPHAYRTHPLATTKVITVEMEYDREAEVWVTSVRELDGLSTFGETESAALDNTAEAIRGYLESMRAHRLKVPLSPAKLTALRKIVGCS